jgi:hypothetical protein
VSDIATVAVTLVGPSPDLEPIRGRAFWGA